MGGRERERERERQGEREREQALAWTRTDKAMSSDVRFKQTAEEVMGGDRTPGQAVALAVALVAIGGVMLGVGMDIVLEKRAGHGIALVVLGGTVVLPGAYYCYIAWNAYQKRKGFDWSLMQEM